jgi:uncharacterized protein (TIGR00251 family)
MARRISVTVKPAARQAQVSKLSETEYRVAVKAPAEGGRANDALIGALAQYFAIPKSQIKIIHGHASRRKLVELGG